MRKYIIEYLGSVFFLYVFVLFIGNPLAIGAAQTICMYLGGPISGGHFNPLGTLVMTLTGKHPAIDIAPYIMAQMLAVVTVFVIYKVFHKIELTN